MVAERPRLCETGEDYHLGKVRRLHRDDSLGETELIWNRRADHLDECSPAEKLPARRNPRCIFKKENRNISFRHNSREVRVRFGRRFMNGGERAYIGGIATRETVPHICANSEMGMTGGKGIPDGIIEQHIVLEL
jgi:hypothetical protein